MGNPAQVDFDNFVHCFVPVLGNFLVLEPVADAFRHAGIRRLGHVHADEVVAGGCGTLFGGGPALELLRLNQQFYSHFISFVLFSAVVVNFARPGRKRVAETTVESFNREVGNQLTSRKMTH